MSLNSSQVRGQDVHSVLAAVASNPSGSLLAWRHLQRHWAAIWTTFHSGSFTMGAIIKSVVSHFSTQFDYDQVKIFNVIKNIWAIQPFYCEKGFCFCLLCIIFSDKYHSFSLIFIYTLILEVFKEIQ